MKKILILTFVVVLSSYSFSQTSTALSWEKTSHNYGKIKEEEGPKAVDFKFKNTGSTPISLTNVETTCGCTSVNYTKETIEPGANGQVSVTYDPTRRPGLINRTVTVNTNTGEKTVLRVEGEVIPREKTILDLYPREFGNFRLKTSNAYIARILNTEKQTETIEVINAGSENLDISFENVPEHINVSINPKQLKGLKQGENAGEKGIITIVYDASKRKDWGQLNDRFNVIINGEKHSQHQISITATIIEDFSHLSDEDIEKAPKIEFKEIFYDFGTVKQGEKVSHNYEFTNIGQSDLIIRKLKTTCGCTATNPEKMVIKPGESSHITVTYNSTNKKGSEQKTITVISNSPTNSNLELKIKGVVEVTN